MNNDLKKDFLAKGYSDYLSEMFCKMVEDLLGRANELTKLTGIDFTIKIG